MRRRGLTSGLAAVLLLCAAAVPVLAALERDTEKEQVSRVQTAALDQARNQSDPENPSCGPVYMPTLVHERDGSIVGMAYVLDGDDC